MRRPRHIRFPATLTCPREQRGVTAVELIIAIAIIGLIATFAVPAWQGTIERKRLTGAAEAVYSELARARTEAMTRARNVSVSFFRSSDGETWALGLIEKNPPDPANPYASCDPRHGLADANPCVLSDGGGRTLRRMDSTAYPGVKMVALNFGAANRTGFDYVRGTAMGRNGTARFESENSGHRLHVVVAPIGRVRICSPAGATHVSGYASADCPLNP